MNRVGNKIVAPVHVLWGGKKKNSVGPVVGRPWRPGGPKSHLNGYRAQSSIAAIFLPRRTSRRVLEELAAILWYTA